MEIRLQDKTFRIAAGGQYGPGIAEVLSDEVLVAETESAAELLANLYYRDFYVVVLHEKNIVPAFFDLRSGMAGEILQKVSNFRMRLAVVGDFSKYPGQSLKDFIAESNRKGTVIFAGSAEEAARLLSTR